MNSAVQPVDTAVVSAGERTSLVDLFPEEIAGRTGLRPFQGRQIFHWIYAKQVFDFDRMTDLSKAVREQLKAGYRAQPLELVETLQSPRSKTKKVLLRLRDGETVESVLLRDEERTTLCISTQVGCPLKCSFCATGLSGYTRNLTPGEITGQALFLLAGEDLGGHTPNIVYMGMGEPFRNYDDTMKSIRLLMRPEGLGIGARKITVSTAGEVPGIERFSREGWQVRLSVSLHAANDALRDELVPLNRRYNLTRLMDAVRGYVAATGRQVTFEWALLEGVNDSPKDAQELFRLIGNLKAFVNLIPFNPVSGLGYRAPSPKACRAFRDLLTARGIKATLRVERGQDINAACGQLRRHSKTTSVL